MDSKYIIDSTFGITDGEKCFKPGTSEVGKINNNTKEMVEEKLSLKNKIIGEISKTGFPDLGFIYSDESLKEIPNILDDLLDKEKEKFDKLLEKDLLEVTFDDLDENSKLDYLFGLIDHLDGVNHSEVSEKIVEDFEPKLIDFGNTQLYSKKFYEMHAAVLEKGGLDNEQIRILEKSIDSFKRNGINLPEEEQAKIKEISIKLSKLSNDFTNNITKDKGSYRFTITDFEVIKDLPKEVLDIAKSTSEKENKEGYTFTADPTSYLALMEYCTDSDIRKQLYIDFNKFASEGKFDNRPVILELLKLKKEKVNILGYKDFAEFNMTKKMAESADQIFELIGGISKKAKTKALVEIEDLKEYFGLSEIKPWDMAFYSRKLKEEKYDVNEKELKKYFEYNEVIKYLFEHIKGFYGVDLVEIEVNKYSPDVKVYEVYKDGNLISYYFLDAFYRAEKRPGAWANNLRSKREGEVPVVLNVCNFQKVENGDTLLSMRDVETLFHEFGHGIHEMLSESEHSELSGFHVEWDFVELPSQINENWVSERESLAKLAKHHETGESISVELLDKLDNLKVFNSGNAVLRQNEFSLLDMYLYTSDIPNSVEDLDKKVLDYINGITVFPKDEKYKMYTSFNHIFGGGYSAGYYSYMWAELLEADVFEKIKEMGMFNRETGRKFVDTILGQGTKKPAVELFRDFMGRDLDNAAFMRRKGLV